MTLRLFDNQSNSRLIFPDPFCLQVALSAVT